MTTIQAKVSVIVMWKPWSGKRSIARPRNRKERVVVGVQPKTRKRLAVCRLLEGVCL